MILRLKLRSTILLLVLCCYQQSFCMDLLKKASLAVKKKYNDYKTQRDVDAAFDALARHDHKTLAQLVVAEKVAASSANQQGVTLFQQLLETKNHRAVLPLIFGYSAEWHALTNTSRIRSLLSTGPESMQEVAPIIHDDKPLSPPDIRSYVLLIAAMYAPHQLEWLCESGLSDVFNCPHKNCECAANIMPYLHERALLYGGGYREKKKINNEKMPVDALDEAYTFLLPYLSPRAFESITNYAELPERDLPKTTALINRQRDDWKAMSVERNALVKSHIHPCEGIVRQYLEGNEYQRIECLLSEPFADRWQEIDLTGKIPDKREFLQENIIMHYMGGLEYLKPEAEEASKRYSLIFHHLHQRLLQTPLYEVMPQEKFYVPAQLIAEYSEGKEE